MSAAAILSAARKAGISLSVLGDRLAYEAPRGAMTPVMRSAIRQQRGQLIELLRSDRREHQGPSWADDPAERCNWAPETDFDAQLRIIAEDLVTEGLKPVGVAREMRLSVGAVRKLLAGESPWSLPTSLNKAAASKWPLVRPPVPP